MTDAAITVTQEALESFAAAYLSANGYDVETRDAHWTVTPPSDTSLDLLTTETTIRCGPPEDGDEPAETDAERRLYPGSEFAQSLIDTAIRDTPTGRITLGERHTDLQIPDWLTASSVSRSSASFTPYYDRTAVVTLIRVSIETVSEYETSRLRAIALDTRTGDQLPDLPSTVFNALADTDTEITNFTVDEDRVEELVDRAGPAVVSQLNSTVDEIHNEASSAADAELAEYDRLQEQRIEELADEVARLEQRIDDLSSDVEEAGAREARLEHLQKRKDLRASLDATNEELEALRTQRAHGYPDTRREIRDRHAIEVVSEPVSLTEVGYEQGEVEFELNDGHHTRTLTCGYGRGAGVTEDILCENCGAALTGENPLVLVRKEIRCQHCSA
ncbi:hypothetical protein ACFQL9_13100 [Halobaculum lipolyticum]|uniref:Uncharacterized protein n=1 Tax=Halobaculum lipolyticum TaxID=3032001 RepID=A0ABD5WII7_9EURY